MRYFDFAMQSLILLTGGVSMIIEYPEWLTMLLFTQLFFGAWQMASAFISVISAAPLQKQKTMHLLIASCYLIFLYACANSCIAALTFGTLNFVLLLTIPAWTLGIYYYMLTFRWAFARKKKRGNFLPNLSF